MLDEPRYLHLVDEAFKTLEDALDRVDPDDAEAFRAGDVITITFRDKTKCIVNTQRPTRQIWLAARSRAWHFDYDAATGRWLDDKGRGDELFATLRATVLASAGVDVTFA
jgi:CyaY protein